MIIWHRKACVKRHIHKGYTMHVVVWRPRLKSEDTWQGDRQSTTPVFPCPLYHHIRLLCQTFSRADNKMRESSSIAISSELRIRLICIAMYEEKRSDCGLRGGGSISMDLCYQVRMALKREDLFVM